MAVDITRFTPVSATRQYFQVKLKMYFLGKCSVLWAGAEDKLPVYSPLALAQFMQYGAVFPRA